MNRNLFSTRGFTLIEILIVATMVGMVFLAATSLYTSSLRFVKVQQSNDITTRPEILIEDVVEQIVAANNSAVDGSLTGPAALLLMPTGQLNVRVDATCADVPRATPQNTADDTWRHFHFVGGANGQLLFLCNAAPGTALTGVNNPAGTTALLSNLDSTGAGSRFQIINPSAVGSATVVSLRVVSTSPATTLETEAALGASSKR